MKIAYGARTMKTVAATVCLGLGLFVCFMAYGLPAAHAQKAERPTDALAAQVVSETYSEYLTTRTLMLDGGLLIDEYTINGPPTPPPGYELDRTAVALPESIPEMGTNTLTVPAFNWVFGCSSVSGSMIAGYYDRNGYPNIYTGPTNGGVMPLDNSSWPTWTDVSNTTYPNIPLAASHQGVDGRTTRGSIDDYWVEYGSSANDPYITNGWTEHTWGDAIGDYMKTSQSGHGYNNTDGSTSFYNYNSLAIPLTCSDMLSGGIANLDGTYGRKLFYEARGYTVTDCYSQKTDNTIAGGFSFAQYKAEIDAGRPVMLNLEGHTIVGVGYDDSTNTVYIHDTWDYNNHTMTWGGSYSGMQLLSVSIVNLQSTVTPKGAVTVNIGPQEAINAGAQWQLDGGAWQNSGATASDIAVGSHTVAFKSVTGWITPASQTVTISDGATTLATGSYTQVGANFIASATSGKTPLKVIFTDQSVGPIKQWYWDFGDGKTARKTNNKPLSHVYTKPGTYTVSLTCTTSTGDQYTATKTNYISAYQVPKANFIRKPPSGKAPLTVAFTNKSTGSITGFTWDFGDGTTSTESNPSHTYNAAAKYTVSLTAVGPVGTSIKTIKNAVNVKP